jgi:hypothetical protein
MMTTIGVEQAVDNCRCTWVEYSFIKGGEEEKDFSTGVILG